MPKVLNSYTNCQNNHLS